MNPDNTENNINDLEKGQATQTQAAQNEQRLQAVPSQPKRSYKPRDKKEPTIASLNEQIKIKKLQQETLQVEIDDLTAKRNQLFVAESELLGLLEIMADPESASWLAKKVEESNTKRN